MQNIKISVADQFILLRPVAFDHLETLSTLVVELQSLWIKNSYAVADLILSSDKKLAFDLMQKIVNLHRRADTPGEMGFDITQLDDLDAIEALFFMERNDSDKLDSGKGCQILRLNRFDIEKKLQQATKLEMERLDKEIKEMAQKEEETEPDLSATSPSSSATTTEVPKESRKRKTSPGLTPLSVA